MPYRDQTGRPNVACHRHASNPADASCAACLEPICEICLIYEGAAPHCPPCARSRRRRRTIARVAFAAGVVGIIGGGLWHTFSRPTVFTHGKYAEEIQKHLALLDKEPCDRTQIVELGEAYNAATDYRGALRQADGFFRRCGEHPRLLWVTYTAHQRLSEWDAAIADATKLIAWAPEDSDYWWWRAEMHEQKGDLEKAAADYRKTMELNPRSSVAPWGLARMEEKLGRPCDAIPPILNYLRAYPQQRGKPHIVARIDRLKEACGKPMAATAEEAASPSADGDDDE